MPAVADYFEYHHIYRPLIIVPLTFVAVFSGHSDRYVVGRDRTKIANVYQGTVTSFEEIVNPKAIRCRVYYQRKWSQFGDGNGPTEIG